MLAVLLQATPPLQLDLLALILNQPAEDVRKSVERLYFGLRIANDERLTWADQDFFDFAAGFTVKEAEEACGLLAEFCRRHCEQVAYARTNLSRHFFIANWNEQLVDWWLAEDRLVARISEISPHEEDVLTDVQYASLAAMRTKRFADALKLLAVAADIKQGRDVFSTEVKTHTDIAVECGYLDRLIETLEEQEEHDLPSCYFRIARSLASHGENSERIKDLISRGSAIIYQESARRRTKGFSRADVLNIGAAQASVEGFAAALNGMQTWNPPESVHPVFGSLTRVCAAKARRGSP